MLSDVAAAPMEMTLLGIQGKVRAHLPNEAYASCEALMIPAGQCPSYCQPTESP